MGTSYPGALDTDATLYHLDNVVESTLVGDLTPSSGTVTVASASAFPTEGGILAIYDPADILNSIEYVRYTSRTSTQFTGLVRGANPRFPPRSHSVAQAEVVALEYSAEHHNGLKDAVIAIETVLGPLGTPQMLSGAGPPTVSNIPAGRFAVWNDTTAGTVRVYANLGGVLKSVLLV